MNKYSQKYYITNGEMDMEYRLKPISVIMYFQDCVARYMTLKNLAAFDISDDCLYWVVSEFNIDFIEELPFWSEEIEVTAWVSEISKLKTYVDFELKHKNKVFARGNSLWFILNALTKRLVTMDFVAERMEVCPQYTLGEHKKFQLPELKEKIKEVKHTINISDLDFNNHTNNKSYLNIAASTASEDFKNTHSLKKLTVKFNRESFLNDVLTCSTYTVAQENTYIHKLENNGISICDILTEWQENPVKTPIQNYKLDVRN